MRSILPKQSALSITMRSCIVLGLWAAGCSQLACDDTAKPQPEHETRQPAPHHHCDEPHGSDAERLEPPPDDSFGDVVPFSSSPLLVRTGDGPRNVHLLWGKEEGEESVYLAIGSRIVLRERERDVVGFYRIQGHYDYDFLVYITQGGGPGTCVWYKQARVFTLFEDELLPRGTVELGGYLECADGEYASCGCGTWEASWRTTRERIRTLLTTSPRVTYSDPERPPKSPPPSETLSL